MSAGVATDIFLLTHHIAVTVNWNHCGDLQSLGQCLYLVREVLMCELSEINCQSTLVYTPA